MTARRFFKTRFLMFASPWISVVAIGILTVIIVIVGVSNFRRERQYLEDRLFRKGQDLIHFVGAGVRAAMMNPLPENKQIQQLVEQAATSPDIVYISVFAGSKKILAHSDPEKVDDVMPKGATAEPLHTDMKWEILQSDQEIGKVFEVSGPFAPFRRGGHHMGRWRRLPSPPGLPEPEDAGASAPHGMRGFEHGGMRGHLSPRERFSAWRRMTAENGGGDEVDSSRLYMSVGLDMSEMDDIIRRRFFQISIISTALLLVGFGGLVSLLTIQGYKVAQRTLTHIKAFTSLIISRLPVGIIATDHSGAIRTMNRTAADIAAVKGGDALGRMPSEVLSSEIAGYLTSFAAEEQKEEEAKFTGEDNREYDLKMTSLPIQDEADVPIGRALLIQDLTELKKLQKEVQQRDRLVALGKMAAGVAHEMRNPLSSIKGFATLLGSRFQKGTQEYESAKILIAEVERLNRTITELLNYTKPLPLRRQSVDVNLLIENSIKLVQSDAQELGVKISRDGERELPPMDGDPDRLNQVLLNLYLNGLQAMEEGGRLIIGTFPGRTPSTLEIRITDTGHGIKETDLDKIFDPYFTTKTDGTGLGLAMVKKIVEEHGGLVMIESVLGKGTTVTVVLPLSRSIRAGEIARPS